MRRPPRAFGSVAASQKNPETKRHPEFNYLKFRRSEEHTSELQSRLHLVCRLLLEKKKENDERPAEPPARIRQTPVRCHTAAHATDPGGHGHDADCSPHGKHPFTGSDHDTLRVRP